MGAGAVDRPQLAPDVHHALADDQSEAGSTTRGAVTARTTRSRATAASSSGTSGPGRFQSGAPGGSGAASGLITAGSRTGGPRRRTRRSASRL